ncbi:MAG: PEP-CTERM sorting domain-containing protein [Phycisphaerae bacterium]|jgi:hypothetical protein
MREANGWLLAALAWAMMVAPATAGRLVTINNRGEVCEVDAATGRTLAISTLDVGAIVSNALAYDPTSDTVYLNDTSNNVIRTLNPDTGKTTVVGTPFPGADCYFVDLAYNSATGKLYASQNTDFVSTLYEVNTTTGLASLIGTNELCQPAIGYETTTNTMYATGIAAPRGLYTIDCETAAATFVGDSGVATRRPLELTYDWDTRTMFLLSQQGGTNYLETIDLETGARTLVGSMGTALNMRSLVHIPEPASFAALATGALAVLHRRRTRSLQ